MNKLGLLAAGDPVTNINNYMSVSIGHAVTWIVAAMLIFFVVTRRMTQFWLTLGMLIIVMIVVYGPSIIQLISIELAQHATGG